MNNDTASLEEFKPYAVFECASEEVYDHLVGLIEKDTPKTAELNTDTDGITVMECPRCDEKLDGEPNYCPNCGQYIK